MEWIKVFHLMMMTSWFAGLFYLPRLFVNHAMAEHEAVHQQLTLMEGKLYRFVTPIMLLTLASGAALTYLQWDYLQAQWWFAGKMAIILLLVAYHLHCGRLVRIFASGKNVRSHVFYRFFNEVPVFGLIGVLILVVIRPFS